MRLCDNFGPPVQVKYACMYLQKMNEFDDKAAFS